MKRRTFFGVIAGAGAGAMVPAKEPMLRVGDRIKLTFTGTPAPPLMIPYIKSIDYESGTFVLGEMTLAEATARSQKAMAKWLEGSPEAHPWMRPIA